ncbi:class I SAM-dependent methyltransferase [Pseudonocardia bannensis]|uniref:Methyltransferase n=1 Tax=Pseudonocardia bannensis TaxID=630973 RepID=A0A848DHT3_9PSEU|nr:50S ribosomal protein L11 methyltransferase [Pseudonocardia bannensis]NMH92248.1 methyltransferase [Pseudonocardia bannensis]
MPAAPADFIRAHTRLDVPPCVPEIRLHLADDVVALWEQTEAELRRSGLPPPFWGAAWAGGQALARYLLDSPETVRGRTVFDFASGCGLAAIAAAKAGAASVTANEIDEYAIAAIGLNTAANDVTLSCVHGDVLDRDPPDAAVVLAGDICYDKAMVDRVLPFLERLRERGSEVFVGDPGRAYLPKDRFEALAVYDVPVPEMEGVEVRRTTVWRVP